MRGTLRLMGIIRRYVHSWTSNPFSKKKSEVSGVCGDGKC